jgi:acyl-CoA synthetase (NDP forming)
MPFDKVKSLDGSSTPLEYYLLANNEGCLMGQALKMVNGRLTKAAPTDIPEFISQRAQLAEAVSKTPLPVVRTTELDEYETTSTVAVPLTNVGAKVTIHSDGAQVTNTTAAGVFLITATDAVNKVRGIFRR